MFPERLTKGYRAFLEGRFAVERGRYQSLAGSGQAPSIMVIGCVDSRVSPEVIFDAAPGEILVARNVANLVPRYEPPSEEDPSHQHGTSAALEFAVRALKVRHIVVLGHAFCGGIRAFVSEDAPLSSSDFIGRWMSQIAPAATAIAFIRAVTKPVDAGACPTTTGHIPVSQRGIFPVSLVGRAKAFAKLANASRELATVRVTLSCPDAARMEISRAAMVARTMFRMPRMALFQGYPPTFRNGC